MMLFAVLHGSAVGPKRARHPCCVRVRYRGKNGRGRHWLALRLMTQSGHAARLLDHLVGTPSRSAEPKGDMVSASRLLTSRKSRSMRLPVKSTTLASLMLTFAFVSPTLAQGARWNELANLPVQQDYPTRRRHNGSRTSGCSSAAYSPSCGLCQPSTCGRWSRHRKPVFVRATTSYQLEGTPERENYSHDAELGCDLCHGLCGPSQRRPARDRVATQSAGHP